MIKSIKKNDYEILQLNRGKANPINNSLVTSIRENLTRIKEDTSIRGIILTGNTPGFFCVGLDLKELFNYDEVMICEFWENWESMISELVKFPKPTICAINGYCPAGGCVLAITCDYRFMANGDQYVIGLNETSVGIVVPEYIFQLYQFWVGKRLAYINLMEGNLLNVKQAKAIHLVDEICEMNELLPKAEGYLRQLLRKPDNVLTKSKQNLRAELIKYFDNRPEYDKQERLKSWFDPESRAVMKELVQRLTK